MLSIKKPRRSHSYLESRALLEVALHFSARPLTRFLPRGDKHPVLIIPGFLTNDAFTAQLRTVLQNIGYEVYGWERGLNTGICRESFDSTATLLKELVMEHRRPVSIIGWSLGGLYARALANQHPECVRQVITLGTPFNLPATGFDFDSKLMKFFQYLNAAKDSLHHSAEIWQPTPSVPTTSIYTTTDGIAHWHYCLDAHEQPQTQNIQVAGSHSGLVHNPFALYVIADRLRYQAKTWRPFKLGGWHRWLFASHGFDGIPLQAQTEVGKLETGLA